MPTSQNVKQVNLRDTFFKLLPVLHFTASFKVVSLFLLIAKLLLLPPQLLPLT